MLLCVAFTLLQQLAILLQRAFTDTCLLRAYHSYIDMKPCGRQAHRWLPC